MGVNQEIEDGETRQKGPGVPELSSCLAMGLNLLDSQGHWWVKVEAPKCRKAVMQMMHLAPQLSQRLKS